MALSLVLSGPKDKITGLRGALEGAGFRIGPEDHSHGLPSHRDGPTAKKANHLAGYDELKTPNEEGQKVIGRGVGHKKYKPDPNIAWLTIEGDDVDKAAETASHFHWHLRMYGTRASQIVRPGDLMFSGSDAIADLQRQIDELKGKS